MTTPQEHQVSVDCAATPRAALAFLADGLRLGRWGLGSMDTVEVAPGVVRGTSLFDGSHSFIRPVADEASGTVTYHVGSSPQALSARIRASVLPGPRGCTVSLHAQRAVGMDEARWQRLVRCHEVEILLIQAQLEQLGPHPFPASP